MKEFNLSEYGKTQIRKAIGIYRIKQAKNLFLYFLTSSSAIFLISIVSVIKTSSHSNPKS